VELLVSISVIAVLVGILLPALGKARETARSARELAAGQQVIVSYHLYADDAKGYLLPGYCPASWVSATPVAGVPQLSATNAVGQPVFGAEAQRYPWRLAPYFDYNIAAVYKDDTVLRRLRSDPAQQDYLVSLYPSFGLNSVFLGGDEHVQGFNPVALRLYGRYYAARLDQPRRTSGVIAFASAYAEDFVAGSAGAPIQGYFRLIPPRFRTRLWPSEPPGPDGRGSDPTMTPQAYGFVSYRHSGSAATMMLDGHAELKTFRQLEDQRFWADQATRPEWFVGN
jgi:prepilin-type processing-associated H-X9-DG protein